MLILDYILKTGFQYTAIVKLYYNKLVFDKRFPSSNNFFLGMYNRHECYRQRIYHKQHPGHS